MNHKKLQVWLPLFFSLATIFGMFLGYKLHDNLPQSASLFRKNSLNTLQEVMALIRNRYVDEVNTDSISQGAIELVLSGLDPHSTFIPASKLQTVNEDLSGRFEGIGIEFNLFRDTVHVITVLKDGPSDRAGLQPGDRIIRAGDSLIAGRGLDAAAVRTLLRGPRGSKVTVTLDRSGTVVKSEITRGYIPLFAVEAAYLIRPAIGYIRLAKFSETAYEEFMTALEKLQSQGMKELILDLRENGGGIMEEAVEIADEFLDGNRLIVYTEGVHHPRREHLCRRNGLFEKGKLILLMDEGSASASEVLAGALQDWDRAIIIGRRSFGKGLVQEQYALRDGSALRLTIARYYSPLGRSIQKPYTDGPEKYGEEIMDRFHSGQLSRPDSSVAANGQAYRTQNGKLVYSGGGISPDLFIPLDTMSADSILYPLYRKNIPSIFVYRYYIERKANFAEFTSPADFNQRYQVPEDMIDGVLQFAEADSIHLSRLQPADRQLLSKRLKTQLARQIWRTEGYFEVANSDDPFIRKALEESGKTDL